MRSSEVAVAAAALSLSFAWCGGAWADEASEKALEQKVEELQRRLDDLSRRMSDGANRSDDELEQRIAELEKITKKDQDGLFAYWKNGLKLDSADGAFKLSIFGRIQDDFTWWDAGQEETDELGEMNSAAEFRRARIGVGGTIYRNVIYKFEMDFAGGSAANWADAYIELKDAFCGPGINVRVGNFDEPFGLDRLTSSKYGTFVERGLMEAFSPARNNGIMVLGQALDNRLAWFAGAFRESNGNGDDINNDSQGEHNLTGRVAGRPWVSESGTEYAHLGAAVSLRNPPNETIQYRSRPEVHTGPQFVDTGAITDIDEIFLTGLEGAAVFGPLSFQGEWVMSSLSGQRGQDDYDFDAQSIQASYFLTGENREYETAGARFDRIKVKKNYGKDGMGAWEVALRYSTIDLDDGDVEGNELDDWTLGLNWYLNPNTRVMFNVTQADRSDLDAVYVFTVRFAIDF